MPDQLEVLRTLDAILQPSVSEDATFKKHHVKRAKVKSTSPKAASSSSVLPNNERSVIFLVPASGFSNAMLGLITSYLIAALTNSTLLRFLFIFISPVVDPQCTFDSLFTILDMNGNVVRKASMFFLSQ